MAATKGAPASRLGVAKWLVDKENPLTARVAANRFWAAMFGNGIVPEADGANPLAPIAMLHDGTGGLIAGGLLFFALGVILARVGQKKLD